MKIILFALFVANVVAQGSCQNGVIAGELSINNKGTATLVTVPQSGGTKSGGITIQGNLLKINHGVRAYFGSGCVTSFEPGMYFNFSLLNRTISYTVDLSQANCACNAALYLVGMPAHNQQGNTDATKCGDFYCDANDVCGINCPEIDIMEANTRAWQTTPHRCSAPSNNYYPSCDGGGCGRNTYKLNQNAYGLGSNFQINTQSPFQTNVTFSTDSNGQFNKMTTILGQSGKSFTLTHDDSCGSGYLSSLTDALSKGMVVTLSYWGDTAQTMSWLDIPPCSNTENCNTGTSFTVSNFAVY